MACFRLEVHKAVAVLFLILLVGCSTGSDNGSPAPAVPMPSDPWFGTVGNVLISDRGLNNVDGSIDFIWIGFNSQTGWQAFLALNHDHPQGGYWIGGKVVASSRTEVGVYFDPATTMSAEVTAEAIQTSLDQIKRNPQAFDQKIWVIPATVEQIR